MSKKELSDAELDNDDAVEEETEETVEEGADAEEKTVKRGRGRPKGSRNKAKFSIAPAVTVTTVK